MKLSKAQKDFLTVLLDGKARSSRETAQACGRTYFGVDTSGKLCKHDCIQPTTSGWVITDIGRTAVETGILP